MNNNKINTLRYCFHQGFCIVARGVGQVMFQNHALSGLLMLLGIFVSSWHMGLLALGGNLVSTLTALCCGYDRTAIRNGLYGFNGTLVGIAAGVFLHLSWFSVLLTAAASALSTVIARIFAVQRTLSGFTAPFILAVWILLTLTSAVWPDLLLAGNTAISANQFLVWEAVANGIGQVMFQANVWTGILFVLGIWVCSRSAAFYALWGALLPLPLALMWGEAPETINLGLMGYNGVLCAIAIGERSWKAWIWASVAVLLSLVFQLWGMALGITTLTAPFVLSVWMIQLFRKISTLDLS